MAYITYTYTRTKLSDGYNTDNRARLDGEGKQIHLAKEIESTFPNKMFKVRANHEILSIVVDENDDFTPSEKTTLDQIIWDHQNNA